MKTDPISEVGIDPQERLYVRPATMSYPMIYRDAVEVNWDPERSVLFSPKPRKWSYLEWFCHIVRTADSDSCRLVLTTDTHWVNIEPNLKSDIMNWMKKRIAQQERAG